MTLLAGLVIALLTSLGYWQIMRAHEKQRMLTAEKQTARRPVIDWRARLPLPAQYQRVRVRGKYGPTVFLLDNQHHYHVWGYHVLNALQLENDQVVLVDRGWIGGNMDRTHLPDVTTPLQRVDLIGRVYYPPAKQWVLGEPIEQKSDKFYVIEKIDTNLISQVLHKSVYPFIIRLDKNAVDGYVREWPVVTLSPARHYGYAVQWFAMAIAVLVIYIVLNLKKTHEKN